SVSSVLPLVRLLAAQRGRTPLKVFASESKSHNMPRMFRVASYNMRKAIGTDRRRRPERTIEVFNELDADIIALQEADRRFGSRSSAVPVHMLEEHSDYVPVPLGARANSIGWH